MCSHEQSYIIQLFSLVHHVHHVKYKNCNGLVLYASSVKKGHLSFSRFFLNNSEIMQNKE